MRAFSHTRRLSRTQPLQWWKSSFLFFEFSLRRPNFLLFCTMAHYGSTYLFTTTFKQPTGFVSHSFVSYLSSTFMIKISGLFIFMWMLALVVLLLTLVTARYTHTDRTSEKGSSTHVTVCRFKHSSQCGNGELSDAKNEAIIIGFLFLYFFFCSLFTWNWIQQRASSQNEFMAFENNAVWLHSSLLLSRNFNNVIKYHYTFTETRQIKTTTKTTKKPMWRKRCSAFSSKKKESNLHIFHNFIAMHKLL